MTVLTPRRDLPLLSPVEPRLWWRQKGRTRLSGGKGKKRERGKANRWPYCFITNLKSYHKKEKLYLISFEF